MTEHSKKDDEYVAPPGHIWICQGCGKKSKHRRGDHGAEPGWDVSCFLHAQLVKDLDETDAARP